MGTWAAEAPRCSRIVSPAPGGQAVDEHVRPPVERRPRALPVNLRVADRADPAGERRRERADGRDRLFAGLGIPRADHPGRHDGPAVLPGGDERQRRGPHDVRDDGELPGGRLRGGGRPGDHLGARREHRHPAGGLAGLVEPEPQPGRDAEVAAAAPKRPEEPGMGVLVRLEQLAAAVTTSAPRTSSIVSPCSRTRKPVPPPRVIPRCRRLPYPRARWRARACRWPWCSPRR